MTETTWSTAAHDVVPPVEFALNLGEVPTYLHALLRSEHEEFREPYDAVRANINEVLAENEARTLAAGQKPTADVSGQRLRTWKKVFEEFGLLYVEEGDQRIRTTALGDLIRDLHDELRAKVEGANDHVARLGLAVLSRHVLRNPLVSAEYPTDTDLHPYRAIWRACRALDDRIHWEELNRVLLSVLKDADIDTAIAHIRGVRAAASGSYVSSEAVSALGDPAVDEGDQTRRRITPWLTKAGFGGTFLREDTDGYWALVPEYVPLIDEVLNETPRPPDRALATAKAYLDYLISGLTVATVARSSSDEDQLRTVVKAVERFGNRKIIALSGLPGTGKTRLARMVAAELTQDDLYRFAEVQFHESTSYDKFVEGFVPRADGTGFQLQPMTLRVINKRARTDPGSRTYVLLIEELTRANVHAVLGELLTYVEHRDRSFRLLLSQEEENIAPNLVILATMNPRDRSAMTLDHAILRRIHQVAIAPSVDVLREIAASHLTTTEATALTKWYETYYQELPFGHGEFTEALSGEDLRDLWRGTLIHFLTDSAGVVRPQYLDAVEAFPWRTD